MNELLRAGERIADRICIERVASDLELACAEFLGRRIDSETYLDATAVADSFARRFANAIGCDVSCLSYRVDLSPENGLDIFMRYEETLLPYRDRPARPVAPFKPGDHVITPDGKARTVTACGLLGLDYAVELIDGDIFLASAVRLAPEDSEPYDPFEPWGTFEGEV